MKTRALKNYNSSVGIEVYDIDFTNNDEIIELGKLSADQCIVYINQNIPTPQLVEIMRLWGDPSRAPIHKYIVQGKLQGRHWREILLNLGLVNKSIKDLADAASYVTYKTDSKNRPMGLFANGELDWHCDQVAIDDAPRVIGLQSISDSANSQTQFLCTHDAYESLSSDMKSIVQELIVKHVWREGDEGMSPGLRDAQSEMVHYNSVPLDGLETRLYTTTATGRPGIKLPHHSFDGFVGMDLKESQKILNELQKVIFQEKYVYTQNWQDGQLVLMDQEITLHKRPTNITAGNLRTMIRVVGYYNKIFPNIQPSEYVRFDGKLLTHDEFAKLVDESQLRKFIAKEEQLLNG